MKMKQRYQRTYERGRPTNGWEKGERITNISQINPGDVLISINKQFKAENLIRVLPIPDDFIPISSTGFYYEYVNSRTLQRSDGGLMFDDLVFKRTIEYYHAIDRRPKDRGKMRIAKRNLPAWLKYPEKVT